MNAADKQTTDILDPLEDQTENNDTPLDLKIDYVTRHSIKKMSSDEKCGLIVNNIRKGRILVFEGGLDSKIEVELIQKSMEEIDHEKFLGLELYSPNKLKSKKSGRFSRDSSRVTVIAPAGSDIYVRTI